MKGGVHAAILVFCGGPAETLLATLERKCASERGCWILCVEDWVVGRPCPCCPGDLLEDEGRALGRLR